MVPVYDFTMDGSPFDNMDPPTLPKKVADSSPREYHDLLKMNLVFSLPLTLM